VILSGSMQTSGTLIQNMTVTVPPGLTSIKLALPDPPAHTTLGGTSAKVQVSVASQPVASSQSVATDAQGNSYTVLTFTSPPPGPVYLQATYTGITVNEDLGSSIPTVVMPLSGEAADVLPFLKPSPLVQSDEKSVKALASSITSSSKTEYDAAAAISAYLQQTFSKGNVRQGIYSEDAAATLKNKVGGLIGLEHAFIALARASGIPARMVQGVVVSGEIAIPDDPQSSDMMVQDYEGGQDYWVELWYPGVGWTSYQPPITIGYIDSLHVPAAVGRDYGDFLPHLYAVGGGLTGHPLPEKDVTNSTATQNKIDLHCTSVTADNPQILLLSRAH
jgi:transglutaminase-like putative cysteine protease